MAEFDFEATLDAKYGKGEWHCDDIYSNKSYPTCVIDYLHVARAPAHGLGMENVALYATYKGKRVRVTMASRLGDVGIMYKLAKDRGYDVRVFLPDLTDFSSTPVYPLPEVSEFLTAFKDDIE
jgi:hypothetical protein